jgi:hypothetical protein
VTGSFWPGLVAGAAVVRRAGAGAVRAHWPGTDDGFAVLARLTGLSGATPS